MFIVVAPIFSITKPPGFTLTQIALQWYLQFIFLQVVFYISFDTYFSTFSRYKAVGIRLDSGDLAYLSCESRKFFQAIEKEFGVVDFGRTGITASNDLNEETLDALNKQVKANSYDF